MHPLDVSGKRHSRLDDSSHSRTSTDDVHSLCSQLSNLTSRPRTAVSSKSTTRIRTYLEPARLPANTCHFKTIRLEKTESVVEFVQLGDVPTFKKQASRSTNNPWRRYGALRKLCETGGFAPNNGGKRERKNREQLVPVKQNVKIPPAPNSSQMTLNKVRDPGVYEKKLALCVPKNATVDMAARKLAEQVKLFILHHGIELVEDESVLTAHSK